MKKQILNIDSDIACYILDLQSLMILISKLPIPLYLPSNKPCQFVTPNTFLK